MMKNANYVINKMSHIAAIINRLTEFSSRIVQFLSRLNASIKQDISKKIFTHVNIFFLTKCLCKLARQDCKVLQTRAILLAEYKPPPSLFIDDRVHGLPAMKPPTCAR